MSPPYLTSRLPGMPTDREIRITNWIVFNVAASNNEVGGKDASKGKDIPFSVSTVKGKREEQEMYHPVSEDDRNRPKLLRDITKEGNNTTEADQEGEEQEKYKEEDESCNRNFYVTTMFLLVI